MPPTMRDLRAIPNQQQFTAAEGDLLAAFGAPRWTPEEQAADPTQPRTRLIKDVLPVGKWQTDSGPWEVTPALLGTIARNTNALMNAGYDVSLCKTHGEQRTKEVHPNDLIQPIDEAKLIGDMLWVSVYVTPEQAAYLQNPPRKVSVRQIDAYTDGAGNKYGPVLLHVAVVNIPVVGEQGPFKSLSKPSKTRNLSMDFAALVASLNNVFVGLGASKLPEGVTEETMVPTLDGMAAALGNGDDSTDTATEGTGGEASLIDDGTDMGRALSKALAPLTAQIRDLSTTVATLTAKDVDIAKTTFIAKVEALCKAGRMTAATRIKVEANGKRCDWDLSLLDGYTARVVDMGRKSEQIATNKPPVNEDGDGRRTDEEVAEKLKKKGLTLPAYK